MIERKIVIGFIVSTEFIQRIRPIWEARFLESVTAQKLATWCIEHFDEFNEAPGKNIDAIYFDKLKAGDVTKDIAEDMEDLLQGLSDEYEESFNAKFILKRAQRYFSERHLELHLSQVRDLKDSGKPESIAEAERLAASYRGITFEVFDDQDLSDPSVLVKVESAFLAKSEPVVQYPGALGDFWNHQLVRGGFIGILAREKLGKTFLLLDMGIRATRQKSKVAFFQAGDMTEAAQLLRVSSYLAKKPIHQKYCGVVYSPVLDCIRNQLDTCDKRERECDFGPFAGSSELTEKNLREKITQEMLIKAHKKDPDYATCRNCKEFYRKPLGVPWVKRSVVKDPVDAQEAVKSFQKFFVDGKKRLRISTHANGTLSMERIDQILDRWYREDGFVADLILIDYADILETKKEKDFRHKQNQIWRDGRRLSQERNALVVLPTQADAQSYKTTTLRLSNFSEDKRKYAHVTAMYGMNQDKENVSREKKLGVMRMNELVIREGSFDVTSQVTILQNLNLGRPYLGSYF